jgi:phospholipase C
VEAFQKITKALRATGIVAGMGLAVASAFTKPVLAADTPETATPIQHLVIIFQENVSFDHYFATYPFAANTDGSTFNPIDGTPSVNGLGTITNGEPSGVLLTSNLNTLDGKPVNPFRLSHGQASTCDQDPDYQDEQSAFDLGLMDNFPGSVGVGDCKGFDYGHGKALVMGYFDGNTTTALWNYAQNFAMSDNSYGTTFGPSTPGLMNLVAGQTAGVAKQINPGTSVLNGTVIGDPDPLDDVCSAATRTQVQMSGKNIGDLLNAKDLAWGSFMGGFDLTVTNPDGSTGCKRQSPATPANGGPTADYIPHHAFFQYWPSTANPKHTRPSVAPNQYGSASDTAANHNYDIHDFFDALNAGNLPAVSFLKAAAAMDGHAGYSDPLLEQQFIASTVNTIEKSEFWKSTAIIIMYDDSDGWYDHQMSPIVNPSASTADTLSGSGKCGNGTPLNGLQGRCGYGPRLPFIVVSPFAKRNFVDHSLTDQSSVLRFIEDNWDTGNIGGGSFDALAGSIGNMFDFGNQGSGARRLFLDPNTGAAS